MILPVLIDTGPLVAAFHVDDPYHLMCSSTLPTLRTPMITSWPVITEATYLLRKRPETIAILFRMIDEGTFQIPELPKSFCVWFNRFCERYGDLQPQLADATLVYLAETMKLDTIFTLDRRHFSAFRNSNGKTFKLLPKEI